MHIRMYIESDDRSSLIKGHLDNDFGKYFLKMLSIVSE